MCHLVIVSSHRSTPRIEIIFPPASRKSSVRTFGFEITSGPKVRRLTARLAFATRGLDGYAELTASWLAVYDT
jgi:hypothetical protein